MFYFILGLVLVTLLHFALRAFSGWPDEKRSRVKRWAWQGFLLSVFFVVARYAPWIWLFVRPHAGRNYQHTYQHPHQSDMTEANALAVLGLRKGATRDQIKQAYRDRMRQVHPDHGGNVDEASRLNQARDYLLKRL